MYKDLITIQKYWDLTAAYVDRNRLEAEGIRTLIDGETTISLFGHLANAAGGVKLMVAAADAERASEILGLLDDAKDEEDEQGAAPGQGEEDPSDDDLAEDGEDEAADSQEDDLDEIDKAEDNEEQVDPESKGSTSVLTDILVVLCSTRLQKSKNLKEKINRLVFLKLL